VTDPGRLLIVDDETPVREVLSEYFGDQGYAVQTAADGNEALAAIGRQRPDVVLADIRMPGMDGVELLRRLRDLDSGLAVIMVTAVEDLDLVRETLRIGAFDYVAKPFDFKALDQVVAAGVISGSEAVRPATARPAPPAEDPWTALSAAVFRAVRAMAPDAGGSMGKRLEDVVLAAAREAGAGQAAEPHLAELERLIQLAVSLGDLGHEMGDALRAVIATARRTLPGR
jgi:two-component system response regulator (stage 0 sporulation protein F)